MTDRIDVDAFVAQLADDDAVFDALLEIDDPIVNFVDELRDERYTAGLLAHFAAPTPAPRREDDSLLDRLVARATLVALEFQLRGKSLVADGDEFEDALYATFEQLDLPQQPGPATTSDDECDQ